MGKHKLVLNILKDNMLFVALVILLIFVLLFKVLPNSSRIFAAFGNMKEKESAYRALKQEYDMLKQQRDELNRSKKVVKDGKTIFEAPGMQNSPEASFAPLSELVLSVAQQSGIRIRAIDYNYSPANDIIYKAQLPGYNVCELAIVAVGTYTEFQTFFKTMMKESYLTSIAEIEMTPWEKDKKILITNFKLRLYAKTID